jgi:hypothetical protein
MSQRELAEMLHGGPGFYGNAPTEAMANAPSGDSSVIDLKSRH